MDFRSEHMMVKSTWYLFRNAFIIAFKHSGRRLLCLLCVLLFCAALLTAFFTAPKAEAAVRKAKVGVINLDENPLSVSMMNTLLEGENLSDLIEVVMLLPDGTGKQDCTAVITVPQGFLESVLNGENISPILEVDLSSPLEAMWIRQMAVAGARALSAAQLGVYAVLDAADYGRDMDARQYNLLVADVNLTLLRTFFDRLSLLSQERLSASGQLSLPQYYAAALAAALVFCYGFLFYPAMEGLRRFTKAARCGSGAVFLAGALHILVLEMLLTLPIFLVLANGKFQREEIRLWLALSLLAGGTALFCTQIFRDRAACAAASILLTLGQALCGGLLVPLALLPAGFSSAAHYFPLWQGMRLFGASMGETASLTMPLAISAVAFLGAALLWGWGRRRA